MSVPLLTVRRFASTVLGLCGVCACGTPTPPPASFFDEVDATAPTQEEPSDATPVDALLVDVSSPDVGTHPDPIVEAAEGLAEPPPPPPPIDAAVEAQPAPIFGRVVFDEGTTVETLAGDFQPGLIDGRGVDARFFNPVNVVLGPTGQLLVMDFDNGRVRRVSPDGEVTTLPRTPANFQFPFGAAFAPDGRLYIQTDANSSGNRSYYTSTIWEVAPDSGSARVVASDLGRTRGLAFTGDGELILTDNTWHRVMRLDSSVHRPALLAGSAEGIAGFRDGAAATARFFRPDDIRPTADGKFVVADARNHCLRVMNAAGDVVTFAGQCGQPGYRDGPSEEALFNFPQAIAVDLAGQVFVSDIHNHRIRRIDVDGNVTTLAGDGEAGHVDGPGLEARFFGQEGLDVSPDGMTIYVADGNSGGLELNHFLRVIRRSDADRGP